MSEMSGDFAFGMIQPEGTIAAAPRGSLLCVAEYRKNSAGRRSLQPVPQGNPRHLTYSERARPGDD